MAGFLALYGYLPAVEAGGATEAAQRARRAFLYWTADTERERTRYQSGLFPLASALSSTGSGEQRRGTAAAEGQRRAAAGRQLLHRWRTSGRGLGAERYCNEKRCLMRRLRARGRGSFIKFFIGFLHMIGSASSTGAAGGGGWTETAPEAAQEAARRAARAEVDRPREQGYNCCER